MNNVCEEDTEANDYVEKQNVRDKIRQIWGRARVNAFAHRAAAEVSERKAYWYFCIQLTLGMLSILFVLLAYVASSDLGNPKAFSNISFTLIFTILSVISAASSLYVSILQNYIGHEKEYVIHQHNHHSYLHLAQRAREVEWPDISLGRAISILEDLERDFQVLKVRGREPRDKEFERAHKQIFDISKGPASRLQSFHLKNESDKNLEES